MDYGVGGVLDGQQSRVECEKPNGQLVGLEHAVVAVVRPIKKTLNPIEEDKHDKSGDHTWRGL